MTAGGNIGNDFFNGIENVTGTDFPDSLTGNFAANQLDGGEGRDFLSGGGANDILNGGNGDDALFGGTGADTLNGGEGEDTASYFDATGGVTADLILGRTIGLGQSTGDILISIENLQGSAFSDFLRGDGNDNTIVGGNGENRLNGRGGDDVLFGGDDDDLYIGGEGEDRFVFGIEPILAGPATSGSSPFGNDTIADFDNGIELMEIASQDATSFNDLTVTYGIDNTVITLNEDPTSSITLTGITADITADDFLFLEFEMS